MNCRTGIEKTAPDAEAIQPPRPAFRFTKVINGSASDHVLYALYHDAQVADFEYHSSDKREGR